MVCGSYSGGNTGLTSSFVNGQRQGNIAGIEIIEFAVDYSNSQSFVQRSFAFAKFAIQSIKLALTQDYDLVFATSTPLTAAIPGIIARWLRKKHFIFEVRDLWPELPKAMGVIKNPLILKLMSILEWLAYKSAQGHIGLSPGIVSGIQQHLVAEKKVALIPNGCDLAIFSADSKAKPWQPQGITDSDFVAVFAGTHGQANGLDSIIATAALLKARHEHQIKIILIGQGKLKSLLQQQAKQQKLDNVIFLEPVDKEKLSRLMRRANVGLQLLANIPAFYYGTSPNKFFDYIAAGLPVINNYPGWLAELIEQHQCGIAVPPDDISALANALIKLNEQRELLTRMSQRSLALAQQQFDRQQLAQQFVEYVETSYKQNG